MPEIENTFTVEAPPEEAWNKLTDMEFFAHHLPGFLDYEEVSETQSVWEIQIDLVRFEQILVFDVEVTEEEYPYASFTLEPHDHNADGSGSVRFQEVGDKETEIEFSLSAEAHGTMAKFTNQVIKRGLKNITSQFVENVQASDQWERG